MEDKKYIVDHNHCRCHPETCGCQPYAIFEKMGDAQKRHSTYFSLKTAEQIASLLNEEKNGNI